MRKSQGILLLAFIFVVSFVSSACAEDYRLGPGDVLNISFWVEGYEEGLQVRDVTVRPDGKIALSFSVAQLEDYRLGPGDTISVSVWGYGDLRSNETIRPDGKMAFPLIGEVEVSGMTPSGLTTQLTEAYRTYMKEPVVTVNVIKFRRIPVLEVIPAENLTADELTQKIIQILGKYMKKPQVNISFVKFRTIRVYVLGEVRTPGMYEISKSHNLLDAIGSAGGYTKYSNKNEVYVIHKETGEYQKVNLQSLLKKADMTQNVELADGDLVYLNGNALSFVNDILPYITSIYQIRELTR